MATINEQRCFLDSTLNLADSEIVVKKVEMQAEMQSIAIDIIRESLKQLPRVDFYTELSRRVKSTMDRRIGGPWHCVVGARFACNTSNDGNGYMHIKIGHYLHVIVYRTCPIPPERKPKPKSKPMSPVPATSALGKKPTG